MVPDIEGGNVTVTYLGRGNVTETYIEIALSPLSVPKEVLSHGT